MIYWKRFGLFYYATLNLYYGNGNYKGTLTKKLDFISFHLIKYFHGEQKLKDIAVNSFFKDVMEGE